MSRLSSKVQYAGMSAEAIEAALKDREENGYEGLMPPGACISATAALARWLAGERAYQPSLSGEPFFVQPKGRRGGRQVTFSLREMRAGWFGAVFREVGDEMGFRPHSSGLNSVRRNSMVGVQKGAERAGFDPAMHAKKTSQHRGDGHSCREKVYEDSTASTDICAFLMGRTPQTIESLTSLAMTRVPELAQVRTCSDVAADDPLRGKIISNNAQRLAVVRALDSYAAAAAKSKSAALRSQAKAKEAELADELRILTQRLEKRVLEQKRQQVYADGQRALQELPIEEFKARAQVADWGELSLEDVLVKLAAKSQSSKPVRARTGACSYSCDSGAALTGTATDSSSTGSSAARAERLEQRRQLRAQYLGLELVEVSVMAPTPEMETAETPVMPQVEQVQALGMSQAETSDITTLSAKETPAEAQETHVPAFDLVRSLDMNCAENPIAAEAEMVETAQAESPSATIMQIDMPAVEIRPPVVGFREKQRQREDELLVRYEQMQGTNARQELSRLISVPLGTLDGMLSRARKRRRKAAS